MLMRIKVRVQKFHNDINITFLVLRFGELFDFLTTSFILNIYRINIIS